MSNPLKAKETMGGIKLLLSSKRKLAGLTVLCFSLNTEESLHEKKISPKNLFPISFELFGSPGVNSTIRD